jgi:hypothetical protein
MINERTQHIKALNIRHHMPGEPTEVRGIGADTAPMVLRLKPGALILSSPSAAG